MGKLKCSYILVLLLLMLSCDKNISETYTIENTIENTVKINFFKNGIIYNESIQVSGVGILKTETITDFAHHFDSFMQADSVRVIFDNNRVQVSSYKNDFNLEGSILDDTYYFLEEGSRIYKITQENYDNAVACDGDCD